MKQFTQFCGILLILFLNLLFTRVVYTAEVVEPHDRHLPIQDDHYPDGNHDVEFDHQAILGSRAMNEEFDKLSPEESKAKLKVLLQKMDTNQDEIIDKEELTEWILQSFRSLDAEEAREKMVEEDTNEDGKVSFEEYTVSTYGLKPEELETPVATEPVEPDYIEMYAEDKLKFNTADSNKDGVLQLDEYTAFVHPWDYKHMHHLEIKELLREYDSNKNGKIEFSEYLGPDAKSKNKETVIVDQENFNSFDQNKDGVLNDEEIQNWAIPDLREAAEDEASHLLENTDKNSDGKLEFREILADYSLWVGSAVTGYGDHLHDPSEL